MTLTNLAGWSQIAASLAVILTLVYLTIQIRQNSALIRAESRRAMMSHTQQEIFKVLEYPEIFFSMYEPQEPSPAAKVRLGVWLNAVLRAREHEWLQFKNGVLDPDAWNAYKQVIPLIVLGTERSRRWWSEVGHVQYHPEFCKVVDDLLNERSGSDWHAKLLSI